jgi:hypothetical protein
MDFAVHGFEDSFFRDGTLLVKEAHELINYFARNSSLLGDYRLVIVPCANPDGTVAGVNNHRNSPAAFGRCTAKHFDINRDFNTLEAVETVALKNIIEISSPDVYLNVHGWLDEAVGDKKPCTIVRTNLNLRQFKNNYGVESGFAIGWVHKNLNIPVALVEYASPNSISTQKDINMIRAIIKAY